MDQHVEITKGLFGGQSVRYDCPKCGERLKSPFADAGKSDSCPDCGAVFAIPGADELTQVRSEAQVRETEKYRALLQRQDAKEAAIRQREIEKEQRPPEDITVADRRPVAVVISAIVVCLMFLNMFGGFISGSWLAIKGGWVQIFAGFLYSFLMPTCFTVLSIPALGILVLLGKVQTNRAVFSVFAFISSVWSAILLCAWTYFVFHNLTLSDERLKIPLIIWGYATTMAPLAYMAKHERSDHPGTSIGLMLAVVSYGILVVLHFAGAQIVTMVAVLAVLGLLEAIFLTMMGAAEHAAATAT